jgi:hypothetical protein
MAYFSSNLTLALANRMILDTLDLVGTTTAGTAADCFVTLHSGTQPTANTLLSDWTTYRWPAATFLGGVNCSIQTDSYTTSSFTISAPVTLTGNNDGTAEWAVIWSTRTAATGGSTTSRSTSSFTSSIPTEQFFVVPVSSISTNTGIVRMNDTNISVGALSTVSEITFKLG